MTHSPRVCRPPTPCWILLGTCCSRGSEGTGSRTLVPRHGDFSAARERGGRAKANPPGWSIRLWPQLRRDLGSCPFASSGTWSCLMWQGTNRTLKISCNPQGWGGNGVTMEWGSVPDPHFCPEGAQTPLPVAFGAGRDARSVDFFGVRELQLWHVPLRWQGDTVGPWFCPSTSPSCSWAQAGTPPATPETPNAHSQVLRGERCLLSQGVKCHESPLSGSWLFVLSHHGSPYHLSRPGAPS